jgi:photosystem II stability/assembly factor-like uncharacterized protein
MKRVVSPLLAVLLGAALLSPAARANHQPCDGALHVEHHLPDGDNLKDVEMAGEEGWAVGTRHPDDTEERPLVVRFDIDSYEATVLEDIATDARFLFVESVSVLSPNEIFVAGTSARRGTRGARTLVLRYDGSSWTQMVSPNRGNRTYLRGIEAIAPDDVWAVGFWFRPGGSSPSTYILHFDGDEWTEVPAPSPGKRAFLTDISAVASNDVWAVGGRSKIGLILHWDGSEWQRMRLPRRLRATPADIQAVGALPSGDAWIVGRYAGRGTRALVLKRDGDSWAMHEAPNAHGAEWLFDVDATEEDVWTTGYRFVPENAYPYVIHSDGGAWSRVATERPRAYGYYEGIAAGESGDAWAVGWTIYDQGALIAHSC